MRARRCAVEVDVTVKEKHRLAVVLKIFLMRSHRSRQDLPCRTATARLCSLGLANSVPGPDLGDDSFSTFRSSRSFGTRPKLPASVLPIYRGRRDPSSLEARPRVLSYASRRVSIRPHVRAALVAVEHLKLDPTRRYSEDSVTCFALPLACSLYGA